MAETQRAQQFAALAAAFSDLSAHLNQPLLHNSILEAAGVSLDAALARLLVGIERHGPIGVVEMSDRTGRDHTTVSRQVAKLVELGFVERKVSADDRRVSKIAASASGARIARALAAAHQRLVLPVLADWSDRDLGDITRLMRRLADDIALLRETLEPA
jgi:DNA-binding MarR family transcriptional regulator